MLQKILRAGVAALALVAATAAEAQTDRFSGYGDTVQSPCRRWATITPSDSTDLSEVPKALYVGGAGDVAMIGVDAPAAATGVTWKAVPAAALLPTRPRRVLATGTTATAILGCF